MPFDPPLVKLFHVTECVLDVRMTFEYVICRALRTVLYPYIQTECVYENTCGLMQLRWCNK